MSSSVWFANSMMRQVSSSRSRKTAVTSCIIGVIPVPPAIVLTYFTFFLGPFLSSMISKTPFTFPIVNEKTRGISHINCVTNWQIPQILSLLATVRKLWMNICHVDLDNKIHVTKVLVTSDHFSASVGTDNGAAIDKGREVDVLTCSKGQC